MQTSTACSSTWKLSALQLKQALATRFCPLLVTQDDRTSLSSCECEMPGSSCCFRVGCTYCCLLPFLAGRAPNWAERPGVWISRRLLVIND